MEVGSKKGDYWTEVQGFCNTLGKNHVSAQDYISVQSRLTSNHARRDRKLCPCHWDAGEKCKYPSPERTLHMNPGVPSIAPHLRVSILCQSCLFNTTIILSSFFFLHQQASFSVSWNNLLLPDVVWKGIANKQKKAQREKLRERERERERERWSCDWKAESMKACV